MSIKQTIDSRGAFCPGPLMELIAALKLVQVGDEIEVLSTDQGSASDIPEWVNKVHHEMVRVTQRTAVGASSCVNPNKGVLQAALSRCDATQAEKQREEA